MMPWMDAHALPSGARMRAPVDTRRAQRLSKRASRCMPSTITGMQNQREAADQAQQGLHQHRRSLLSQDCSEPSLLSRRLSRRLFQPLQARTSLVWCQRTSFPLITYAGTSSRRAISDPSGTSEAPAVHGACVASVVTLPSAGKECKGTTELKRQHCSQVCAIQAHQVFAQCLQSQASAQAHLQTLLARPQL